MEILRHRLLLDGAAIPGLLAGMDYHKQENPYALDCIDMDAEYSLKRKFKVSV
jgi:hypothetical protein